MEHDNVPKNPGETTRQLNRAAHGDVAAGRDLFPVVYQELRRIASARLSGRRHGHTLQTTALVHEAYLRVLPRNERGWDSLGHFYFTAARAMRDIVVEEARRRVSLKRGGRDVRVPWEQVEAEARAAPAWGLEATPEEVIALDAVLARLEGVDADGHRLVLLRAYAGLSMPEIADAVGVPLRTVERKWRFLKVWLQRELGST